MSRRRTTWARPARPNTDALVVYGVNAVRELLRTGGPVARVVLTKSAAAAELAALAERSAVTVEYVPRDDLDRLVPSSAHQGAVAVRPPFRYAALEDVLAVLPASVLVVDGVQDPRNLGAVLRTARGAGVGGVVLPKDRCAGITPTVVAASAGHVFGLTVAQVPNLVRAMESLRQRGCWLVGLAPGAPQSLYELSPLKPMGLVLGGEGDGIRPLVARSCDFLVSIPMAEGVESLNVSVAAGIALYHLFVRSAVS